MTGGLDHRLVRRGDSRAIRPIGDTYLRRRGDADPAARLLTEGHLDGGRLELERSRDLVADLHGERLAERTLVAKARQVDLQRLRLETVRPRPVGDGRRVEVGLTRDRADGRDLVADHL